MPLFFARHQHTAETCPAKDIEMGQMLLQHVSRANALRNNVQIRGEAVLDGLHTLILILEAPDQSTAEKFMQPFAVTGTVEVLPASNCEEVVERGGCENPKK